jgi:drug/metabolite transporter (DMT)-like permease
MIVGVMFSFLASVCFSVSNLMEKTAVDRMPNISARRTGHMLRQMWVSRLWICGFALGVVAVIMTVIAYSLAPIVVVQTIIGAGLALLVLGSRLFLRETIGRKEYIGLCFIIVAVVLVSVTLNSANTSIVSYSTFGVLAVSVATLIAAIIAFRLLQGRKLGDASLPFGLTSGLLYGIAALQAKGVSTLLQHHGLLGGVPTVLASPYPYVFIVASILGLLIFQSGLQQSRIAVIGPISSIIASVYVVVVGMIVFHETLPRDAVDTFLRVLGFALALGGSWIFATGPSTAHGRAGSDRTVDE